MTLLEYTIRGFSCGCRVTGTNIKHCTIHYCPKHNEAPRLYEACKLAQKYFSDEIIDEYMESETVPYFKPYRALVLAIAAVEGK